MRVQLLRASALEQSPETFRAIVERHQARVYSIALRIVGERGAAEEVAQDVFLELHGAMPRLDGEQHVTAWLRRVACHRATDAVRRRAARGDRASEEYQDGMALRPVVREFMPLMNRVEQLLLTLPPAQRAVMLLRYQEDLEPEEIALELKMPIATVRSNLQRAVKMLRAKAERTLKEYSRG
jgi:RNA polymerase sigma-70 factor (ECF subfamily)